MTRYASGTTQIHEECFMNKWIWAGTTLIGFLLAGCSHSSADSVTATREQNGQTLELAQGQTLMVELAGNPTTGYEWAVDQADATRLRLAESSYKPDSSAVGAGGLYTFRFEALESGSTPLVLVYRRSWEPRPIETWSLTVTIP
jgi:inhibitor of cysteine peptidase